MLEVALSQFGDHDARPSGRNGGGTGPSKRLGMLASLSADDLSILRNLKGRTVPAGSALYSGEDGADAPGYFLSGWGARVAKRPSGERQIVTLLLPGDGFGIGALRWAGEKLPVYTLADTVVLDATSVRELVRQRSAAHAQLIQACERAAWLEQEYAINQTVRLGHQNAYERVAHFVQEMFVRLNDVGMAGDNRFSVPLRQKTIADIVGLSRVHFNRVARSMKHDDLVDFPRGAVEILDPVGLAKLIAGKQTPSA